MTAEPATRRINRGKGHSYLLDGAPVDGVTRSLSEGYPKPALVDWAGRVAAGYAVDHWDELAQLSSSERLRRIEKARYEVTSQATVRGTAVHELAQRLQAGEEIDVPEPLVGHVDAYLRFVHEWQPREILVEAPVFSREFMYGGTVDLVADLNDNHRWILDFKTSKGEPWPEVALQLAAYRYAEFWLDGYQERAMPRIDRAGVIWLRADGYDLIPIDAGPAAFAAFGAVQHVAQFRAEPREHWVGQMLQPSEHVEAA